MAEYPRYEPMFGVPIDTRHFYEAVTEVTPELPRDESVPKKITRLVTIADLLIEQINAFGEGPDIEAAKKSVEEALVSTLRHYAGSKG